MSADISGTAIATLNSLEERLRRVEWYLNGRDVDDITQAAVNEGKESSVPSRLMGLEDRLGKLSSKSPLVNDLLRLHTSYPDLFHPDTSNVPTTLSTPELLAIINSSATLFPNTASRLNAMKDLPIPPAELSTSLIALNPRLAKVQTLQQSQAEEIAELRIRSAASLQRWYELGVLGESECWTEWEGRVTNVEKMVRRAEIHELDEQKGREAYKVSSNIH